MGQFLLSKKGTVLLKSEVKEENKRNETKK